MRSRRQVMTACEVAEKSQAIAERFISEVNLDKVKSVHFYKSIPALNEPDTKYIADQLDSKVEVVIGKSYKNSPPPTNKFDLIIVPCLAFDKNCNRLGWGGGWYDRFLAEQPGALKIGLAYQGSFIDTGLPVEPHDITLDKIVTEEGIISPS